ncbi:hypothetical protein [Ochrobactrum quorumnocens]|uniref:hypothetical protein n=1 Tax=Ochrobactrum quorumnocens TaxID=271865 RepID=UPI00177E446C|nr:hypothetical protein [Ochrobactrum gallinarum]
MVLPDDARGYSNIDHHDIDHFDHDQDLRRMIGKRAEHYSPVMRIRQRIVEATIARLIDYPEQLSQGDPDRVVFVVLHKVALGILCDQRRASKTANGYVEAAE